MLKFAKFLLPCVAVLASSGIAHAGGITGSAYCNITSAYAASSPTIGQLANAEATSGGLCATFTASSINFASGGDLGTTTNTLAGFLNFQAGNVTNATYFATAAKNGGAGSTATGSQVQDGTLFDFTGNTYLTSGQSITLSHDDGALLYFNGVLVPGGTGGSGQTVAGQSPFIYTGPSGYGTFEIIYDSNYLPPAELVSNIAPTPEPSSMVLLGTGILSIAGVVRRRIAR